MVELFRSLAALCLAKLAMWVLPEDLNDIDFGDDDEDDFWEFQVLYDEGFGDGTLH